MVDLISIGTVGIDLYFKGDMLHCNETHFQLATGGKYFATQFYDGLGGGATNVAIGVRKHGCKVALAATIGENVFKNVIFEKLKEHDIEYGTCEVQQNFINISAVLVSKSGERSIINYRPPEHTMFEHTDNLKQLLHANVMYLANLPNVSIHKRTEILQYAKQHKVTTVLNLGTVDCRKEISEIGQVLESTDILIINKHEFAELVKVPYHQLDSDTDIVQTYLPQFTDTIFIITDGEKKSYGYANGEIYTQDSIRPPQVIDSTGAGDGYTAGFISQYLVSSTDIQGAMQAGAEYAAEIVAKVGAN